MVADWPASTWLQPDLGVPGIRVVSTTRQGGASEGRYAGLNLGDHVSDEAAHVEQNRAILEAFLPSERTITWLKQVHGTRVVNAGSEYSKSVEADAIWTGDKAFACTVMTADCLPIVLADIHGRCIAAVHGGWRGLASHILRETIEALPVAPEELVAWLGPAIGPTAFEVGGEVLAAFYLAETDAAVRPVSGVEDKYLLDLNMIAGRQLLGLGLRAENISGGEICTFSNPDHFYSHRRDGVTGRMATAIYFE